MPVDRVFSMKGFGTVIAGTVLSGSLSRDADAELLPAGTPLRIRGMQTHNDSVDRAVKGQRIALNVSNVKTADIQRGDELGAPGYLLPTMMTDATMQCLESLEEPLKNRQRVRLHKGTSETIGRLILLDRDELAPGETGYVQLRLEKPIVAERNERFIIRGFSSMRLLGGGRFVEVYPQKNRRFRRPVLDYLEAVTGAEPDVLIERVMGHAHGAQRLKSMQDLVRSTNLNAEVLESQPDAAGGKGRTHPIPGPPVSPPGGIRGTEGRTGQIARKDAPHPTAEGNAAQGRPEAAVVLGTFRCRLRRAAP